MTCPFKDADYLYTLDLTKENMITDIDKYWGGCKLVTPSSTPLR